MPKLFSQPSDILPDGPHYDVKTHLAHVQALWRKFPYRDWETCASHAADLAHAANPPLWIGEDLAELAMRILMLDIYVTHMPSTESPQYLSYMQKHLTTNFTPAFDRICDSFRTIVSLLPPLHANAPFTLPLYDLMSPNALISLSFSHFINFDINGLNPFPGLRQIFFSNVVRASGYDPVTYDGKRKLVSIDDATDPPYVRVHKFLGDTPFLKIAQLQVPFSFEQQRFEHHHVCAKSGHGKTTLYSVMLERDLERVARGEASVIVMDSQGDFLEKEVLRYKEFATGGSLHDRLVYVDPTDIEHPIQLNVFARTHEGPPATAHEKHRQRTAIFDLFTFVFGALDQKLTGRQETLFRAVSALMLEIPTANLTILNSLFEPTPRKADVSPLARYQKYIDQLDEAEQKFFNVDFHTAEFADTRGQVRARVQSLIMNPVFRNMFNASKQALDLDHEMQRGAAILINCNRDFLGDGSELFGRFFIALIRQATQAREQIPQNQRTPCYVYIDECQQYISSDRNLTAILETARKYRVAMLLAHQNLSQLNRVTVQPAVQGCAIKMVGQPNNDDLNAFVGQLRTSKEFLQAQPIGTFATFVNGITPNAVALKVPLGGLRDKPKMTSSEFAQVIAKNREKYCTPEPVIFPPTRDIELRWPPKGPAAPPPPSPPSDIELVIGAARRIEAFLVAQYGATGEGLHSKLNSVKTTVPQHLLRPGHYIAEIRNKVVHSEFSIPDRGYFLKCVQSFDEHMNARAAPKDGHARSSMDRTPPSVSDSGEIPSDPSKRW